MSSSASAPKPTVKGFSKKDITYFEKRLMEERAPAEEKKASFLETINKPLSKLFSR